MIGYTYQARMPDGRILNGRVEAESVEMAEQALRDRDYEVLSLEEAKGVSVSAESFVSRLNRIKPKEVVGAIRMLSVMISAAVPVTDALRNLMHQTKHQRFRLILGDVANEVEGGNRLSDALERYPNTFSPFFTSMVRSGETTGRLSEVMLYLADQQERDYDLRSKLKGALSYPAFILVAMAVAGTVMMVFVVPKLTQTLIEAGAELPLSTRSLIFASDVLVNFWWLVLIALAVFGGVFYAWVRMPEGRYRWDWLKLRVPILGSLLQEMYLVRFCQGMATLMNGGISLVQSLEIAMAMVENTVWRRMVSETIEAVNDGQPMVSVMARSGEVPSMAVQMMAVGEESGKLNEVLTRLADFYARSVSNTAANILTLIEPIVIVVLGLGVGLMVSAIMLPLYNISSAGG